MTTPIEPETQPQPQPQPQSAAPVDRTQLPPFNIMALIAFIGAFIIPVVGIVCGHITLAEYRKGLPERGREYALAGTILGYIFTAAWLVLAVVWIVFAFTHFGHSSVIRPGGGTGQFPGFGGGDGGNRFRIPTPGATPYGN
ncbi:DUF4190 domain-containing protein [Gryllotalpicola protaetiae]|uniref:DUF4190 domain-containing protein n=1 Tax=Gryllotalpicola protaetiae TaxID=2419771 RepID=A0A387BNI1_9MICO|nr:DUF4190 domain-containing protein [Gryllotalpicola protaetiae]AYG02679.1 DUF4190 domain-containing protein [Gryllotalpicola protaetiae]